MINLEPYIVDRAQKMGEGCQLPFHRIVGMDIDNASRRLVNPVGHFAHRADTAFPELIDLALQFRDRITLQRIKRDCRCAEHRVLHEHENYDRQ